MKDFLRLRFALGRFNTDAQFALRLELYTVCLLANYMPEHAAAAAHYATC